MLPARIAALALLAAITAMVALLVFNPSSATTTGSPELVVHCAAALRRPFAEIAAAYQAETGTTIVPVYAPSETVLASATLGGGDLMIPADSSYTDLARARGLTTGVAPVTALTPVIAVRSGNPLGIRSPADFGRPDVRFAVANPGAAIGKLTHSTLTKSQLALARTSKPTVTALATDLALGTVDAAIVWDVVVHQFDGLEAVHTAALDASRVTATAAVLKNSPDPAGASAFLHYLAAPASGFTAHGYPAP